MKTSSSPVLAAINATRAAIDAPLAYAECFTFTLATGTVLTWTNFDQPIVYNGATFSATGPLVQGLKYKASTGLEVGKQQRLLQNVARGLNCRFFCDFSMAANRRGPVSDMVDSAKTNVQKARNHRRCRYGKVYPRIGRSFKGNFSLFSRKPLASSPSRIKPWSRSWI